MYRQIQLCNEHRLFHKILWRETPDDAITVYTLNTVTFGTASAPFLAIRTLHQLAEDKCKNFPVAAAILKQDFYVVDLLTVANTYEEALSLQTICLNFCAEEVIIFASGAQMIPDSLATSKAIRATHTCL